MDAPHSPFELLQKYAKQSMGRLSAEDYRMFLKNMQTISNMRLPLLLENITPAEFSLMCCVGEADAPVTVAQAANHMGVSMPAVSRLLRTLESDGLIERKTDKNDRRSVQILLTEKGRELTQRNLTLLGQTVDRVTSCFSDEELSMLIRAQEKLAKGIAEVMAELSASSGQTQKGEDSSNA